MPVKAQFRYAFLNIEEKKEAENVGDVCAVNRSLSSEFFTIGPEQIMNFLISSKGLENLKERHALHVIVQAQYKPLFFWPWHFEHVWEVYYYEPETGKWFQQRKDHPSFGSFFLEANRNLNEKSKIPCKLKA